MSVATATAEPNIVKLFPKQDDFLKCKSREVLMTGGYGTAKTVALCAKVLWHATLPGAIVGLTRKHLVNLKRTALRTLLHGADKCPPILKPGSYVHHKADQLISLYGGGQIYYFGCDDPQRIGGLNLSAIAVDEAAELDEDEYSRLLGSCRVSRTRCLQMFSVTNPGTRLHFLYHRFVELPREATEKQQRAFKKRRLFRSYLADNPALPDWFLEHMDTFTGRRRARYVEGQWCTFEGLAYPLDRDKHEKKRAGPWQRVIVGVDIGTTSPTAFCFLGVDGDGRTHQFAEYYRTGRIQDEVVRDLFALCQPRPGRKHVADGVEAVLIDPSEPGYIIAAQRHFAANGLGNVHIAGADNRRQPGYTACLNRIGADRHTIDPTCEATWRELEAYELDPRTGLPIKEHDHMMDAWRYAQMFLEPKSGGIVGDGRVLGEPAGMDDDDDDDGWEDM